MLPKIMLSGGRKRVSVIITTKLQVLLARLGLKVNVKRTPTHLIGAVERLGATHEVDENSTESTECFALSESHQIIRTESTGFFTLSRVKLTICKCVPQSTRNLNMKITEAHLDTIESFDSVRKVTVELESVLKYPHIDRIFVQTASTTWTDDNHTTYPDFQQTIHTTHTWNQVEFMDDTNDVLEWSAFCSSC
ncbi:hypothetical protein X801_05330 [Opisthorchis viverrini]|uniref:Uncharacterized protein n=1 Tax=Opisthorchis viverrini TaxID=6198 RepID=A0A1S8WWM5_OPIVI|nr:hypothetical protein X801_05330 [Opisthorchis viverrini]